MFLITIFINTETTGVNKLFKKTTSQYPLLKLKKIS